MNSGPGVVERAPGHIEVVTNPARARPVLDLERQMLKSD